MKLDRNRKSALVKWFFRWATGMFLAVASSTFAGTNAVERTSVLIAVGASGEDEFGKDFSEWAGRWESAGTKAGAKCSSFGLAPTNAVSDLRQLKQALANEPSETTAELWLVLIGHGTYDGKEAKFNLRGPDLSATELAGLLKRFKRPLIIIDCSSSSSPFLNKLSAPGRVIVTATRSGREENFAHFGRYLSQAISDPAADLDKDDETSVLEAFIMASRRVAEFYESEGRLATEHALLDDNGDGLGTPADFFRGVRAIKKPAEGGSVDGTRAHQIHLVRSARELQMSPATRTRRDELEREVARLRETKTKLKDDEYYRRLEPLLRELAELYSKQP